MKYIVLLTIVFAAVTAEPGVSMPGGWSDQSIDSSEIQNIAKFAFKTVDDSSNSLNHLRIMRIINARSQVVAGVRYEITMDVAYTKCRRNSQYTHDQLHSCEVDSARTVQRCVIDIWEQSWLKRQEVTSQRCSDTSIPSHEYKGTMYRPIPNVASTAAPSAASNTP